MRGLLTKRGLETEANVDSEMTFVLAWTSGWSIKISIKHNICIDETDEIDETLLQPIGSLGQRVFKPVARAGKSQITKSHQLQNFIRLAKQKKPCTTRDEFSI